ncbi:hypothetical protein,5-formyltetrahydrofolate cyclo-ligase family protein,5-formyltetrahydrofolate cyclo-ligase,5-formyltetrahydrofolate cyclo-ligase family [Chlamydia serpentis]|uniref:5-formyltetrahydrofolate cyclo-ligase n=1 Tax=Chlamydia serpentis TaxID=1967782 RepID=A0A2R8FBU9_9CHLA|nr:5-formyltetrahydrofolate cyclo-ligase [Chlamydia serpentis]SPN73878.1 hypothetical protein,5-formyltetrahydrofolate cyclo-ligase family protein,5-formyltetrahydrofolate cyclo-ligase,5-formyltetrahydrofolate cyclo-ligase family [Chlamydia serpentis]
MTHLKIEKTTLRKTFASIRKNLSEERRRQASSAICSFIRCFPKGSVVLSFVSFNHEIDMMEANSILIQEYTLALPKIDQTNLHPVLISSIKDLKCISGPKDKLLNQEPISTNRITHAIVPGLAFDEQRYRLGYGQGIYDRWLAKYPYFPTIGVGYLEQKIKKLPQENHDIPLSQIYLC